MEDSLFIFFFLKYFPVSCNTNLILCKVVTHCSFDMPLTLFNSKKEKSLGLLNDGLKKRWGRGLCQFHGLFPPQGSPAPAGSWLRSRVGKGDLPSFFLPNLYNLHPNVFPSHCHCTWRLPPYSQINWANFFMSKPGKHTHKLTDLCGSSERRIKTSSVNGRITQMRDKIIALQIFTFKVWNRTPQIPLSVHRPRDRLVVSGFC